MLSFSVDGGWSVGGGPLAYSARTGGGLLGSNPGTEVGRNLRSGGGFAYPDSCLGVSPLLRFRPLSVDDGASPPVSPRMSVGGGGGEGGGELGGLSTLPTGAGLPSPGRMPSSFFPISARRSAITPPVFLMSALISSVFFERSPRTELLLV